MKLAPSLAGWRPRHRWVALVAVVVVLVLVAGGLYALRESRRTPLDRALALVPAASLRVGFTDWQSVRQRLEPGDVRTGPGLERFMSRAYDTDLSSASTIDESAAALQKNYGFSPGNATWEAYAQASKGAVMVLQLPDSVDMDTLADKLDDLGYQKPGSDTGVWRGGPDLVATLDPTITAELQYVVLDADRHLVLSSDTASYAASAAKVVTGGAPSLAGTDLASLAGRVQDDAAAFLWRGGFACKDLSMDQADDDDRALADRLVRRAGGVDSLDGLAMGVGTGRRLQVALGFESSAQAKANLRPRATLFVGPSPGREGSYSDDFRLTRSRTDGSAVLLNVTARAKTGFTLSLLSQGPVLFATC